jgi:tetratricopeptide (TPR) repeat protein
LDSDAAELLFEQGVTFHEQGRLPEAEQIYRSVLQQDPDHPDALNLLGLLLQASNRYAESEALLQRAVAADPDFAEALTNLARVQNALGRYQDAARSAQRAVAADPELGEAHFHLGRSLIQLRAFPEAVAALDRAAELLPGDIETLVCSGAALLGAGQRDQARARHEAAISLAPGQAGILVTVGDAWLNAGQFAEAVQRYRSAVLADPSSAQGHAGLALGLWHLQNPQAAAEACRHALAIAPDRLDTAVLLAQALGALGDFDTARATLARVLRTRPDFVPAHRMLARIGSDPDGTIDAALLGLTAQDQSASAADRITAAYGLGDVLDREGRYEEAFAAYATAHQIARKDRRAHDPTAEAALLRHLTATFTPDRFGSNTLKGNKSKRLVLIVGMLRTGTSLVEQILASHPGVHGAGEQKHIGACVDALNKGDLRTSPFDWDQAAIDAATNQCLAAYGLPADDDRLITDKLPDNLSLLGHVAVLFPNARVIVCKRDPRDACLSAYFQQFAADIPWTHTLADCAGHARFVADVTGLWRKVLPLPVLEVEYEALVSNLPDEARRLTDFAGLDWDPACLAFHRASRPVVTSSFWQVRQQAYTSSIGRWKNYARQTVPLSLALLGLVPEPDEAQWDDWVADREQAVRAAMAHEKDGRPLQARQILRAVAARHPGDAGSRFLLGRTELALGNFDSAAACLTRANEIEPRNAMILTDLSVARLATGQAEAAIGAAREATVAAPGLAEAWCQLARALQSGRAFDAARDAINRALDLVPENRTFLVMGARINMELNDFAAAETLWRNARHLFPEDGEILFGLAHTLYYVDQYKECISILRDMVASFPPNHQVLDMLAGSLTGFGRPEEAETYLRQALDLAPAFTPSWLKLGFALSTRGDYGNAAAAYRQVLAYDPGNGEALGGLADVARVPPSPDMIARLEAVVTDPGKGMAEISAAAFALANHFDKVKDYPAAFKHFDIANRAQRSLRRLFDHDRYEHEITMLVDMELNYFWPSRIEAFKPFVHESALPVFIVGMPRSGTTLIEQILANHPEVACIGEDADFMEALGLDAKAMLAMPPENWDRAFLYGALDTYVRNLQARAPGATRIVNKLVTNIYHVGYIRSLFPNARVIITKRDLRDVCWSCYTKNFSNDGMGWSDTLEECASHARHMQRLSNHWRNVIPDGCIELPYEDIVRDLEAEARRLIAFLKLPWNDSCLEFYRNKRQVMTASHWQVRQPLYASSVGRWKPYQPFLGPLLEGLAGLVPD